MSKPGFILTRQAAVVMRNIHADSVKQWGRKVADDYLANIYVVFKKIATKPSLGRGRAHRAAPFQMVAAGQHFVIYDYLKEGVVILTLLHQRRDIERVLAGLQESFVAEIKKLRGED